MFGLRVRAGGRVSEAECVRERERARAIKRERERDKEKYCIVQL